MSSAILFIPGDFPWILLILALLWIVAGPVLFGILWSRLVRLERQLAILQGRRPPEPAARATVPVPPQTPAETAIPTPNWEDLLAGHWLNRIGILALLFGVAFFLRYAFQSGWVGPAGRVLIGLLAGVLLLFWSVRLVRSGYRYFADGIAGLGATVLFLSLYAAWSFYHLVGQPVAFSGMVLVTAWLTEVAWRRESRGLILVALVAGLLTPALLNSGVDQHLALFSYLAVLDAAFLVLSERLHWPAPPWVAWSATQIYFWLWYLRFYHPALLGVTLGFALIFFVLFQAPACLAALGRLASGGRVPLAIANTVYLLAAMIVLLWPDHRWPLTIIALAIAAALTAILILPAGARPWTGERTALAGLALLLAVAAVPFRLDGNWVAVVWSIGGLALVERGFASRFSGLRLGGLLVFAAAGERLLFSTAERPSDQIFLNGRFATFAVAVACMLAALWLARRPAAPKDHRERAGFAALEIGLHVAALLALSLEVWDGLHRAGTRGAVDVALAPQMGLSLLWTLYASGLMLFGVRRRHRLLRWQALALFALVIGKVFFYDLSFLSSGYRILSFLVLGALLLGVSFLYQRRMNGNSRSGTDLS